LSQTLLIRNDLTSLTTNNGITK